MREVSVLHISVRSRQPLAESPTRSPAYILTITITNTEGEANVYVLTTSRSKERETSRRDCSNSLYFGLIGEIALVG